MSSRSDLDKAKADFKDAKTQAKASFTVNTAAMLIYFAYRILGANKQHAWNQAKLHTVNAVMDKTVEKIGIIDPRHKGKDGIQAYFTEGGPLDGCSRFVEECGGVNLKQEHPEEGDTRLHHYLRTDEKRGQQTVFRYLGLHPPVDSVEIFRRPQRID
ncbi:hypothetical protein [uncultured Salinicola sp.]|uniref:hypothetical protein n=1 Tax=uncultured Salinicola sp. TaxID=1193542 RepID=UPI00260ED9C0|nr:hypothetical protein [uncultured Salinicola sp.]|tara:strand:- start:517 stop:987 length:471 start_codon:yes stop_codon:yes gene_type:complete